MNAFSALGISSNHEPLSSVWFIDSGASNQMTYSFAHLSNVQKYNGSLQVHTADGQKLSITALGDVVHPLPLKNVFLSPSLTTNLLSVGQWIDDNCNVSFSRSGCVVQDQVSGKVITTGPKCGRLFPFLVPSPS